MLDHYDMGRHGMRPSAPAALQEYLTDEGPDGRGDADRTDV